MGWCFQPASPFWPNLPGSSNWQASPPLARFLNFKKLKIITKNKIYIIFFYNCKYAILLLFKLLTFAN